VLWRWRYELSFVLLAPIGIAAFARAFGVWATTTTVIVMVGGLVLDAELRRSLVARLWCVITPHRLRVGCVEARIHSRRGRLPSVLLTHRVPDGERLLLRCPAGVSAEDFRSARPMLRAACWAKDIRVTAHRRHAQLVTIDVVRADRSR
jgi:hypothetical protein